MRLKIGRYDHYSNSEIDGLAEIPSHWRLERLKSISEIRSGVAKGRNLSGKKTIELPYLRVANVQENRLELDDISMIEIQLSEESRYSLKPGDVLMTEGGDNDKLGRGAVWKGQIPRCLHQNHIFAVRPFDPENSYWINWMTQTEFLKYFFLSRSKQTTNLASISSTNLKVTPIVFPSLYERSAIATYLDTKTAQIDRKIDLLTQKAQRYEELKRALINETVTRGLDKSVPMKDSGIEWIGEIPEHWNIKRLKEILDIVNGSTPKSSNSENWDGDIYWVTTDDLGKLESKFILDTKRKITETGFMSCGTTLCPENSIILSSRAPIGHIGILSFQACTNQGCKTLVPYNRIINGIFLYYKIFASKERLQSLGRGTTFIELSTKELSLFNISLPPLSEQKAIAHYLDTKTAQIDQIIQTINTQIEKLKELRKTLINDVVTGKIKVIEN